MRKFVPALMAIIIAILLALGILGGILAIEADAAQDYPLKIWKQNENGSYSTFNVVDTNTGVNYVVVSAVNHYSNQAITVAITPRLNADGSLYISE